MDAAAVVREGNDIELVDTNSGGEGEIFEKILRRAGREMVLAVLGQTLTSGGEEGGSYALGEVHNRIRWDLVESDAKALERTLTEQLLRPLVELNLGGEYPVPRWEFERDEPRDLQGLAGVVRTLSRAGLDIPRSWVYRKFGIPEPSDDEPVLGRRASASSPTRR